MIKRGERGTGSLVVDVGPEILPEGSERAFRLTTQRPDRFATDAEAVAYLKATSPGYTDAVYENRLKWVLRTSPEGGLEWRSSRDALLQTLGERGRADRLWEVVRAIAVPTTLVRGTNSYVLGAETARRMVEALPHGSLLELEAGHNVPLDPPGAMTRRSSATTESGLATCSMASKHVTRSEARGAERKAREVGQHDANPRGPAERLRRRDRLPGEIGADGERESRRVAQCRTLCRRLHRGRSLAAKVSANR